MGRGQGEKAILFALFLSPTAPLFPRLTSYMYFTKHERKTHQKTACYRGYFFFNCEREPYVTTYKNLSRFSFS